MLRIRDISIRNKLIFMQVFTSLLVLAIFFTVYVITDIKSYKQRKVNNMTSLAKVVATGSVAPLQFQGDDFAQKILRDLQNGNPDIVHAAILDSEGKIFARYMYASGDSGFIIPSDLDETHSLFIKDRLFVSADIIDDKGELLGKTVLEVSLIELEQIKRSKFKLAIILLIVALFVSFMIAVIVQAYISKRLLALVKTMEEVSKTGNYPERTEDDGKDELSTLKRVFNDLMMQIEANQQRKDEFIGIASHELKTPLTTIKGYLDLLNLIEEKQPNKQFVQKSIANIHKLENLIKDLLDVSKIQSGQLELNVKEFDIDLMVDEAITSMQMVSETHDIKREGRFNHQLINADRVRIEQVLVNLLSNAIKYSPGEKKVIVYSIASDKEIIVRVRDFGMGVPKDEQSNIFERFYRTKDMTITITGFGLGLYICRDIIKRHGGRIWMEGEEKGSSFYFSLPVRYSEQPQ